MNLQAIKSFKKCFEYKIFNLQLVYSMQLVYIDYHILS
jgi:hypothetical protein